MSPWSVYDLPQLRILPLLLAALLAPHRVQAADAAPAPGCLGGVAALVGEIEARHPGVDAGELNDRFYLGMARAATVEGFGQIDPYYAKLFGMRPKGEGDLAPELPPFAEAQAAIDAARERSGGGFDFTPANLWDNVAGRAVDPATFARYWAEGKIAHGGAADAPGNQVRELWSAFLLPSGAFHASTDKMAFLQSILDNPSLARNDRLRAWASKKRDEFAAQVQRGLKGLSQDLTMLMMREVRDPLAGPDRILSIAEHLREITGERQVDEIHRALREHASALALTPDQSVQLQSLVARSKLNAPIDRAGQVKFVRSLIESKLWLGKHYPEAMIDHLIRHYDPLRHPPVVARLIPGNRIRSQAGFGKWAFGPRLTEVTFLGVTKGGLRVKDVNGASGKVSVIPFRDLRDQLNLSVDGHDTYPGQPHFPGGPRIWSRIDDLDRNAKVPSRMGRLLRRVDDRTLLIATPEGEVQEIKSPVGFSPYVMGFGPVRNFEGSELGLDPKEGPWATPRWRSIGGKPLITEGPGRFITYQPSQKPRYRRHARVVDAGLMSEAERVKVAWADGTEAFLSREEAETIRPADTGAAVRAMRAALPAPRSEVVLRFQDRDPSSFPDRSAVEVERRGLAYGITVVSYERFALERAWDAKGAFNASPSVPVEAPLSASRSRRYLLDEYIEMGVDRERIERLRPGAGYAWVILDDGELRICPAAGVKDLHHALAEGRNVLSAGTLVSRGGGLHIRVGGVGTYYTGRADRARLEKEAAHVAFAFEKLAGTRPASVAVDRRHAYPVLSGEHGPRLAPELVAIARRIAAGRPLTPSQSERRAACLREWNDGQGVPAVMFDPALAGSIAQIIKADRQYLYSWIGEGLHPYAGTSLITALKADPALRQLVLDAFWEMPRKDRGADEMARRFPWDLNRPEDVRLIRRFVESKDPDDAAWLQEILKAARVLQPDGIKREFPGLEP